MSLDKHRESLVKYSYDISKVAFGLTALNPVASKVVSLVDLAIGLCVMVMFLVFALLLERGAAS